MTEYKNIIIGFGKGGKTLAGFLAKQGESVALIEKSNQMYGGTCINVACIPTKTLEYSARLASHIKQANESEYYEMAVNNKNAFIEKLRGKNYNKVASSGATIIDALASFESDREVKLTYLDGSSEVIKGERIFINTGSSPFIPPIEGLKDNESVYFSETMLANSKLPKKLVIIGGGYIGLEFASMYTNFGSLVTVIQDGDKFIPREDGEVAQAVLASFEKRGIKVLKSTKILKLDKNKVYIEKEGKQEVLTSDAILVATGRRPNVKPLQVERAGLELTERGAIKTNEHLQTNKENIFAMGDVVGGLQFTYISLDDFRIVKDYLYGKGERTTLNRGVVPYTVFLDPPLSRVGLSEEEAVAKGYEVELKRLVAANIPKANVLKQSEGLLKAIVDKKTGLILGAHLFCVESQEMINIVKLAIDAKLPYTVLRDQIYNHPTMSEALNDLFA